MTGIAIYLHDGEPAPVVLSLATLPRERRSLDAWLDENPELRDILDRATALAERESGDTSEATLP